jgi:hypothetical protein
MRYRLKGTFTTKRGKEFVRYWRNSRGVTGWLMPQVKDMADTFSAKEITRMVKAAPPNAVGRYACEPVT